MANNQSKKPLALVTGTAHSYSRTVAANSATQIGVWEPVGGHRLRAVFLCPQKHGMTVMGGPCGVPSGTPVTTGRYANLHGSAHPDWRQGGGKKLRTVEVIAMTPRHPLTLATPSRRARANRHRRLALAALKTNSSVSVRLRRYQQHIDLARQLETREAGQ